MKQLSPGKPPENGTFDARTEVIRTNGKIIGYGYSNGGAQLAALCPLKRGGKVGRRLFQVPLDETAGSRVRSASNE